MALDKSKLIKETVENLIYIVRGQKVMLDVHLARI